MSRLLSFVLVCVATLASAQTAPAAPILADFGLPIGGGAVVSCTIAERDGRTGPCSGLPNPFLETNCVNTTDPNASASCTTSGSVANEDVLCCWNTFTNQWQSPVRDGGGSVTLHYIDWDPGVGGISAGLREALYQCPVTGKCVIEGRPNTVYTPDASVFMQNGGIANLCDCVDDDNCLNNSDTAGECSDIYIIGNGAKVQFSGNVGTKVTNWPAGISVRNIENVEISGLAFDMNDTCNTTDACGCDGHSCASYMIHVAASTKGIRIRDNVFHLNEAIDGSNNDNHHQWRALQVQAGGCPGTSNVGSQNVTFENNRVFMAAAGVVQQTGGGDECESIGFKILGNYFAWPYRTGGTGDGPTKNLAVHCSGPCEIQGNVFDFANDSNAGEIKYQGINLINDSPSGGATTEEMESGGARVENNVFVRMDVQSRGISIAGSSFNQVKNNIFYAGACSSTTTQSCFEDAECPGVEQCNRTAPWSAIAILRANHGNAECLGAGNPFPCCSGAGSGTCGSDVPMTHDNQIIGNLFAGSPKGDGGWLDNSSTNSSAPIVFWDQGVTVTEAAEGTRNVIKDNTCDITVADTTDDCFGSYGSESTTQAAIDRNIVGANYVGAPGTGLHVAPQHASIHLLQNRQLCLVDTSGNDACIAGNGSGRLFHNTDADDPPVKDSGERFIDDEIAVGPAGAPTYSSDVNGQTITSSTVFSVTGGGSASVSRVTGTSPDEITIGVNTAKLGGDGQGLPTRWGDNTLDPDVDTVGAGAWGFQSTGSDVEFWWLDSGLADNWIRWKNLNGMEWGSGLLQYTAQSSETCDSGEYWGPTRLAAGFGVCDNGSFRVFSSMGGGGGSSIILDLGDDSSNESTGILEIATIGDHGSNPVATEPTANKLLLTLTRSWPGGARHVDIDNNGFPELITVTSATGHCTAADIPCVCNMDNTTATVSAGAIKGCMNKYGEFLSPDNQTTVGNIGKMLANNTAIAIDPTCVNKFSANQYGWTDEDEGSDLDVAFCYENGRGFGFAEGGFMVIGDNQAGNSTADGNGDVYIEQELEVDGPARFDSTVDINGATVIAGTAQHYKRVFTLATLTDTATPHDLGASEAGDTIITNEGAGASAVINLPSIVVGMCVHVILISGNDVDIQPNGSQRLLTDLDSRTNLTDANGDGISSDATIGSNIRLCAINATQWIATQKSGTWTDVNG